MRELHINPRLTKRNNGIDRYFSEIGGHQKVSANEEVELAKRIQSGDRAALEILVKANLRFVISVAKQYSTNPELLQDLISQGNIGLTEAAYTFDHTRGFKFISYAVWHIRKEILKYLNESLKTVKLPNNVTLDLSRARKIEAKMSTALGRDPSTEEVVAEMKRQGWNTTVERIEYCRKVAEGSTPFESTDPEEDHSPSKWISSGDSATALLDRSESTAMMRRLLQVLNEVERDIVIKHLGLINDIPMNYVAIGEHYRRTPEWARQVYVKAMKKVKLAARKSKAYVR